VLQSGQWPYIAPIILLFCSDRFMTLAWYGHLKFKAVSLVVVVLVSWGKPSWNIASRFLPTHPQRGLFTG
jgi:uncharacterized protein (DUF486 family)